MTRPKKALKMSDEEILRRRENGESIQNLADKNGVCLKTMQRVLKDMETKKEELHLMDTVGDGTASFYTVININGDEITINKLDGTSETHKYRCIGTYQIGADETMTWGGETFCPAFDCEVYQATDDAGDFTYFFFRDDTMETTYHIEFRYGSDLAALQQYMKGQYAYWLAAGIDANADMETIDNVIALFCTENLSAEEE